MPQMRLPPNINVATEVRLPDSFTHRALQVQLVRFWRSHCQVRGAEHDLIAAQERYETFCHSFLQKLPAVFALLPDKQIDEHLPNLPMQRQQLHNSIYEYLCWNFRQALLPKPEEINCMPQYKRMMISHNQRALAVAALRLLQGVITLRTMMGTPHTCFSGIIVPTFEAAVPLLSLCADPTFPGVASQSWAPKATKMDLLGPHLSSVTKAECMQAARDAAKTLQTLAEVSTMADLGARTLSSLVSRVDELQDSTAQVYDTPRGEPEHWELETMRKLGTGGSQIKFPFVANGGNEAAQSWDDMLRDLTGTFGFGKLDSITSEDL